MQRLITDTSGAITIEKEAPVEHDEATGLRDKISAYVALTKPRIIELLLVTTVPAMIVAAGEWPSTWLVIATLIGGTLSAGGANAINCYIDRDIDQVMPRTKRRPLPMHRVAPRNALVFGSALGVFAFTWLWLIVNPLSAALATAALLFYVFVYTIGMKRSTPQNIVIGGAAGAMPVLVGWAAVTNSVELPALALFGIIFYWTPPHFWALAMRYEKEYAAAGVPMMPVVYGKAETTKHILLYSFMQLAMCLAFFSTAHMGAIYLWTTVVLNAAFIFEAVRLYREPTPKRAWGLFRFSIYFLTLLFAAMALDTLLS
ncbi:MAG: heme o synthase [Actinomycetota bacterium]|jgi:protoheme IX farnesyltransferase|nr:heme o synthase [Actinomycetota bacterium]